MTRPISQIPVSRRAVVWTLYSLLFLSWIVWVIYAFRHAAPGLLDDGIHMLAARSFETEGVFRRIGSGIDAVLHGARFYEVQFGYVGVCWLLFHRHLDWWYAANFSLNVISAAFAYLFIHGISKNKIGAVLAAAIIMTSSPVAETIRAGFGKAEDIMAMFYVCGIYAWYWSTIPRKSGLGIVLATLLFIFACVSKESGNIVALSLIPPSIAILLFRIKAHRAFHLLAIIGVIAFIANYLVFLPSKRAVYINHYFALDFSLAKVKETAFFYLGEMPDLAAMVLIATLTYAFVLWKSWRDIRKEQSEGTIDPGFLALGASLLLFCGGYWTALLGFHFTLVYYAYIPLVLLGLSLGIGFMFICRISPRAASAITALFFITRVYSVGYLFCITGAQRLFDETNFAAFQRARQLGATRIFAMDLPDESQMVQEWNCLRIALDAPDAPIIYGSLPDFKAWAFQDIYRFGYTYKPSDAAIQPEHNTIYDIPKSHILEPETGDVIACRYGTINIGYHYLRSGIPFTQSTDFSLAVLDKSALTEVSHVQKKCEIFDPNHWHGIQEKYGWSFFRVSRAFAYRITGRYSDGWINKDSAIEVADTTYCHHIKLTIEAPRFLGTFPLHVTALSDGESLASLTFEKGGTQILDIPVTKKGEIHIEADRWTLPKGSDSRPLGCRILRSEGSL